MSELKKDDLVKESEIEIHDESNLTYHRNSLHSSRTSLSLQESSPIDEMDFALNETDPYLINNSRSDYVLFEGERVILENKNILQSAKLRFQLIATLLSLFIIGVIDQVIGSILEYILAEYHINRIQVSYLFLAQFCGYIPASMCNSFLMKKFGFFTLYCSSCIIVCISCLLFFIKAPFYILILGSSGIGWSNGTLDCCLNIFVGSLDYSNQLLGLMHSFYGVGCLMTPLLSIFLINRGMPWNHYYLVILGFALLNLMFVVSLFRNETSAKFRYLSKIEREAESGGLNQNFEDPTAIETISNKYVIFYSSALFVYVGSELSVGIWMFNYFFRIQNVTETNASYITSLFWLFMTFGRALLGFVTGHFFEDIEIRAIVLYCLLVAFGCFNFWIFQNHLTIQILGICFAGFFVGPLFSTTIIISIKSLPRKYALNGISLIAGFGGTGAAIIPSLMGYLSEKLGDGSGNGGGLIYFPELVFFMFSCAAALWLGFYIFHKHTFDNKERLPSS